MISLKNQNNTFYTELDYYRLRQEAMKELDAVKKLEQDEKKNEQIFVEDESQPKGSEKRLHYINDISLLDDVQVLKKKIEETGVYEAGEVQKYSFYVRNRKLENGVPLKGYGLEYWSTIQMKKTPPMLVLRYGMFWGTPLNQI